ncbi:hypothetical protein MLP_30120 [Microlunatus phosphovorus NM-1]|uniref:DUF2550 family protein n=1 Tax=Microlunatus phosphovorus (strain ATCC 700054 / DSM 10555 / JCM 9379 / NBRC 101784 / NCIMB 13414 / VKM Ac-1990 / NM-1) TaxID=1032480 RepID=F5XKF4_MICPN|nr:DUF2550 domain-containing protein [Microlunatus phosphovorus]BAK36026.1 hypothetical protein MLP_30120 [Microlunatus phosphovorus NM-1]
MHEWLLVGCLLVLLAALAAAALAALPLRRRWLAREGGLFECSVRLNRSTPGAGWALGMARYNAEMLEWFRFFSYSSKPRKSFLRNEVRVLNDREPDPVEAVALYTGQRIVELEEQGPGNGTGQPWEIAMSAESLTGFLSWLEAAPPRPPRI